MTPRPVAGAVVALLAAVLVAGCSRGDDDAPAGPAHTSPPATGVPTARPPRLPTPSAGLPSGVPSSAVPAPSGGLPVPIPSAPQTVR